MSIERKRFVERIAYQKGYRVSECGTSVISPLGVNRKLNLDEGGYLQLGVHIDGCSRQVPVHRLQGYQKFGEAIYQPGLEVRHLNNNKQDNSRNNIEIGTHLQNEMDKSAETRSRASSMPRDRYNHEEIWAYYKICRSRAKTMKRFGISSTTTIHHILKKAAN